MKCLQVNYESAIREMRIMETDGSPYLGEFQSDQDTDFPRDEVQVVAQTVPGVMKDVSKEHLTRNLQYWTGTKTFTPLHELWYNFKHFWTAKVRLIPTIHNLDHRPQDRILSRCHLSKMHAEQDSGSRSSNRRLQIALAKFLLSPPAPPRSWVHSVSVIKVLIPPKT